MLCVMEPFQMFRIRTVVMSVCGAEINDTEMEKFS